MAYYGTPTVPESSKYSNVDLNALASAYSAAPYSHQNTALIQRLVRSAIYDAAPQQFLDLLLLNMTPSEQLSSDEFFYHEMGYGRDPLETPSTWPGAASAASPATQTVRLTATSFGSVSLDSIIVYPDNTHGTVTAKNSSTNDITVTPQTGQTLPTLTADTVYVFAYHSPVEADGMDSISTYFRIDTIERLNFVQLMIKAMRFGKLELFKYQNAGSTQNYIEMQKQKMLTQFRTSISNVYWNGKIGEVTLANGAKAKTCNGVYNSMLEAGVVPYESSLANFPTIMEEAALDTEFGAYGATRFLYAAPRLIHYISQKYKRDLVRYTPNDTVANLTLNSVDIGSSKIVFVPFKRLEEGSCFPASFRSRAFLLDQASIKPCHIFPEEMGSTLARGQNGTLQNFVDTWVSATFSLIFNNPLGCAILEATDL